MVSAQDRAVALAQQLVSINSVNPSLVPGAAGEQEIVRFLKQRLSAAGFDTWIVEDAGRQSLVALAAGSGPIIAFNGHLDTVGVEGMPHAFEARLEDDRLLGRGAADMKGGVAGIVVAAEVLARDSKFRPLLALVADEEDASRGSVAVIADLIHRGINPEVCLIAEPTDLALCRSLRGFGVAEVSFPGRAAHSSQAELGINAVTHLGRLLHKVDRAADQYRARGGDLMATFVSGGQSAFVIPDAAKALIELRSAPSTNLDTQEEVSALLEPSWNAQVRVLAERPGWQLDESGPAAELATRLAQQLRTTADFDAPYWMEAPLWQEICPTLICGPSGGGLHAVDEWLDLAQLGAFTQALIDVFASE